MFQRTLHYGPRGTDTVRNPARPSTVRASARRVNTWNDCDYEVETKRAHRVPFSVNESFAEYTLLRVVRGHNFTQHRPGRDIVYMKVYGAAPHFLS